MELILWIFNFPTSEGSHIPSSALELKFKTNENTRSIKKLLFIK
jgi:hypothetical protein